ncbi:LysR family transcriptional regulator [Roseibaca sp. Y0-43]|uniref:LysR family transcriptional regulator n=1 Tax=Roseibaca sp. Y0-43 TaxID=2816854 RepID=UPI001D0C7D7A|nr:LysR family transcriptional regulator [Roseibaca sp. Y0-43]MCC1481792.1 LysR family transcriptional regulator [Roseibaca sp. Y0-43]
MKDDRLIAMRVFQAVAETGGFTAAARALGVSQPFVSQTIARLEERLGVSLLHRTTRGHSLTPEGAAYLDGCRRAIDSVDQAEAVLQTSPDQVAGMLRVSAPLAFGLDRITPILPLFLAQYPKVDLELVLTDDSVNLVEDRVDLAIRMGQLTDSSLRARRLCPLRRIVVAAPALVAQHGLPQTPADLARYPCLCWDGARAHLNLWQFETPDGPFRFEAKGRFRSNAGMALFQMCRDGVGIMRCAEHLARPAIARGELVGLLEEFTQQDDAAFHAVFLPGRATQPRLRAFLEFLVAQFAQPDW